MSFASTRSTPYGNELAGLDHVAVCVGGEDLLDNGHS